MKIISNPDTEQDCDSRRCVAWSSTTHVEFLARNKLGLYVFRHKHDRRALVTAVHSHTSKATRGKVAEHSLGCHQPVSKRAVIEAIRGPGRRNGQRWLRRAVALVGRRLHSNRSRLIDRWQSGSLRPEPGRGLHLQLAYLLLRPGRVISQAIGEHVAKFPLSQ